MSEKFIDREYLLDSFKDYNTDIVEKKFDQINSNLVEQKMLGWTVPEDCPIQNSVNGNTFTQNVGRKNNLAFVFVSSGVVKANLGDVKVYTDKLKLNGYTTVSASITVGSMPNKSVKMSGASNSTDVYIKDEAFTDVSIAKSALGNSYLYYELETPITMTIDGNEVTERINESLSDLEYLGWSVPDKCSLKNYKDTNETFHQKVGRVFVDRNTSLTPYNITSNGTLAIHYLNLGISLEEKNNILCCATLESFTISELENNKIGYCCTTNDNYIYVNIKGSASSIDEFRASVNASPLVFYYKLDSDKIIIDGNEAVTQIKNDLGDRKMHFLKYTGEANAVIDIANYSDGLYLFTCAYASGNLPKNIFALVMVNNGMAGIVLKDSKDHSISEKKLTFKTDWYSNVFVTKVG